jgi:hypothetical protein
VFAARRRWVDADRRLSRAVSTFESAGQPYELGRSLVALAAVRRAGGERDWESVDLRARTILDRLGSDPDPDRLKSWLPDNAG